MVAKIAWGLVLAPPPPVQGNAQKLATFGRTLTPRWVGWGGEEVKVQHNGGVEGGGSPPSSRVSPKKVVEISKVRKFDRPGNIAIP